MKSVQSTPQYREILQREFEARCARNARYSLRGFARDLGLSPGGISQILSGRMGLSKKAALQVAKRLGMSAPETERFCDLVQSQHARSPRERDLARIRLRKHESTAAPLQLEAFKVISDWYHLAILELTTLTVFQSSPTWIASQLGIAVKAAELAIERMKKLDLLEEVDGRLRQTVGLMATPSGIPSDAIKKFHEQVLDKARAALFTQSVEERDFSTMILPIRAADLPDAKAKLKEFRRAFTEQMEQAPGKDRVYCLAIQFFSLHENSSQSTSVEYKNSNHSGEVK